MRYASCLAFLALGACASAPRSVEQFASAQVVSDFESYTLRRVGLVPFSGGPELTQEESRQLQAAFQAEVGRTTRFEVVLLDAVDIEEVPRSEPHRRGWYRPRTIIDLARRFHLDALLIGTVTDRQVFPPQRLGVQVDMVASETGQVIWSSTVHLDAANSGVRESLEVWALVHHGDDIGEDARLVLISPRRFARFAAWQIAQLL